jgi:hypothetical protein
MIVRPELRCEVLGYVAELVTVEERTRQERDLSIRYDYGIARIEDVDIPRTLAAPALGAVERFRGKGIVVAREQIHRSGDLTHPVQRLADSLGAEPVMLEDVSGDKDEMGLEITGHGSDALQGAEPRVADDSAGVAGDEVGTKTKLPIRSVYEPNPIAHCTSTYLIVVKNRAPRAESTDRAIRLQSCRRCSIDYSNQKEMPFEGKTIGAHEKNFSSERDASSCMRSPIGSEGAQ